MSISCTSFCKKTALAAGFSALAFSHAYAIPTLPNELLLGGQPIDPVCFENVSADEWVDVNKCTPGEIVKVAADNDPWAKDMVGYRYRYKQDQSDAESYSYYQYVGQWNGAPLIVSFSSGGGTGQFSSLMSIERTGDKVRVLQGFGAGDRCNGGIVDAKLDGATLTYGQNMTPIDFLALAEDNPNDVQPYEDLEASANSCFAIARFEDEKLKRITLLPLPADVKDTASYKYQPCFNKLYSALLADGKKELSVKELKEFTKNFNEVCLTNDQAH